MSQTIFWEVHFFLLAVWLGIRMLLVYDGLRLCRCLIPHSRPVRDAEDVFYWIYCALWAFAESFYENDGQIRWFFLAGIAVGMLFSNFLSLWALKKVRTWVRIRKAGARREGGKRSCASHPDKEKEKYNPGTGAS